MLFNILIFSFYNKNDFYCKNKIHKEMNKTFSINIAQGEILNMMSFLKDENTFVMLKKVISDFFCTKGGRRTQ